jgi:tight adherence protein C
MADEDSKDLIGAIIQGETLGTPLAKSLRVQAEQLRLKRSQWAEKAAEESKVALVFPAMLIMAACLAIVVAPFVLSALYAPAGG